ncbi:tRNA (adenine-n-)-methyltransferase [Colletotrichum musicola]|uniref:tRNA (adenine(58)-N(1))-methyltransferase catalytic subunit TRM61 n=1 Tax=Colletotrichum musicola TaxID=2175873 RepID=A0A8H6NX13_9PEZI|nr:tRNA (adenine-n-)-methyltransferase [Colletotrichum musicola]
MTRLEHFPDELLVIITSFVRDYRGLASLARMNRRLNEIATPYLYRKEVRRQKKRHRAFMQCAYTGQLGTLRLFWKYGQDLRVKIKYPRDPEYKKYLRYHIMEDECVRGAIHTAIIGGQPDIVSWLVSHGVPVYESCDGLCDFWWCGVHTPLQLAVCKKQYTAALIILANGASQDEILKWMTRGESVWLEAICRPNAKQALEFAADAASAATSEERGVGEGLLGDLHDEAPGEQLTEGIEVSPSPNTSDQSVFLFERFRNLKDSPKIEPPTIAFCSTETSSAAGFPETATVDRLTSTPMDLNSADAMVTRLIDPIDALDVYAGSPQKEASEWKQRKRERQEAHKKLVFKRAERRARQKAQKQKECKEDDIVKASIRDVNTSRALRREFGRLCSSTKKYKLRGSKGLIDVDASSIGEAEASELSTLAIRSSKAPWPASLPVQQLQPKHDVIVLRQRGHKEAKFHLSTPLRNETSTKLAYGAKVSGSEIIGKTFDDSVTDTDGRNVRLQEVTLAQYIANSPRVATPDASLIVSFLDINLPNPGEDPDFDAGPPFEIFEAGTGMGALTLHLARAIHGANPPVPSQLREALCTAPYEKNTLPHKVVKDEDAKNHPAEPHSLAIEDTELAATLAKHASARRAVIHTLDVNPTSSRMAHGLVRYFRRGLYLLDVDFHVSTIRSYLSSRLAETAGRPFLSHVILDLPASQDHAAPAVEALLPGGKMVVFYPSITQILEFVVWAKENDKPINLDRVVELQTSTSNGDVGFKDGLGGRHWDVKLVDIRKAVRAGETGAAARGVVCRPKVGTLVVGGGFLAVFTRMPASTATTEAAEAAQPASEPESETESKAEEIPAEESAPSTSQ